MSDSVKLSQRAVAVSALALVLGGSAFAPAFADGGKGGKGDKGRSESAPHGRGGSGSSGAARGAEARQGGGSQGAQGGGQGVRGGGEDPAGNNGTFKVDGLPFDDGLGNEPHVSCGFRLMFYGFDEGQTGDISIMGHAPSGSGLVSEKAGVLLSDDAAGGGPNDRDAIVTYTLDELDLSGLTAHPQQGYHVKVTLETDTPGGVKHKVFWIEPCAPETTPTAVGGTGVDAGDETVENEVGAVTPIADVSADAQDRTAVLGTKLTRDQAAARDTSVLGTAPTQGPLAFTGSTTELLLALGGGLAAAGGALVALGRRPRGKHAL